MPRSASILHRAVRSKYHSPNLMDAHGERHGGEPARSGRLEQASSPCRSPCASMRTGVVQSRSPHPARQNARTPRHRRRRTTLLLRRRRLLYHPQDRRRPAQAEQPPAHPDEVHSAVAYTEFTSSAEPRKQAAPGLCSSKHQAQLPMLVKPPATSTQPQAPSTAVANQR